MSVATALTDLSGRIQDAYTALAAKGATMPATRNSYNLSSTIDTVPTGGGGHAVACVGYNGDGGQHFQLTVDGVSKSYGGIYSFSNSVSINAEYSWDATIQYSDGTSESFDDRDTAYTLPTDKDAFITYWHEACLLAGTKISLADGTTKNIEDITYDDELLVWDFGNGRFSKAKPLWIKKAQTTDFMYEIKFASGNSIGTTGEKGHRAFNIDESKFVYMNDSVGQKVKTIDGTDEVVCCEKKTGKFDFYNIITDGHLNLFANGILTSCRLNNYRKIVGMKFAEPSRAFHIKADFKGLPDRYVDGLRLVEQYISKDELIKYVNRLLDNKL